MLYLSLRPLRTGTKPSSVVGDAPVFSHVHCAPHLATTTMPIVAHGREVVLGRRCAGRICSVAPRRRHSGQTPPQLKSPKRPGSS